MHRDLIRSKAFSRRTAILLGGKLALSLALLGRMYQLQVVDSDRYTMLAEENRIHMRLLPPTRGRILDRFGAPLAVNRDDYRVLLVPEQSPNVEDTLAQLSRIIVLSDAERARVLREVRKHLSFIPVKVRDNLSWDEVARIEVRSPDLPGILIEVGQSREYPYRERAAHVLGYVAAVSEKEQTGDPLLGLPGFRIGRNGVERTQDLTMRGKAGNSQLEVNAVGRIIRELKRHEGQPGDDVRLCIDIELQLLVAKLLEGVQSASAVLLDVATGEVLAMVSVPGFDPELFSVGMTAEEWKGLGADPRTPLINKSIAGLYAPGSAFKPVVALAGLHAAVIRPEERVFCRGHLQLGNARFHCWKKHGHGSMDMLDGIAQSCDVYFYEVARRVGVDRMAAMAAQFGLGQLLGIAIPGEKKGLMPTRKWKREAMGEPWHGGETLIAGIGQGYVLSTPMQLAVMTARLAGGRAVTPQLVLRAGDRPPPPLPPPLEVSPAAVEVVLNGMRAVTNAQRGTAWRARIREKGMEMGGKTGTSQVRRITLRERETGVIKNEDLPWNQRDHAVFIGFAPADAPRYAVSVVVEHGGGGSAVAAPIARDILIAAQTRDPTRRMAAARDPGGQG